MTRQVRIRLHDHPFSAAPAQEFDAPSVGQWLLDHYGPVPSVGVQVFVGEPSVMTEITHNIPALIDSSADVYTVLQSPGLEPGTWAAIVSFFQNWGTYILAAYSVASSLFASQPGALNLNRTSSSPNNQLGARENQVRVGQRVEDLFGIGRSIPSLMMPTYRKYINHRQVEFGYYGISRGWLEFAAAGDTLDIKDGDSLAAEIPGTSAAVYAPFTSPNSGDAPQHLIGDAIIDPILTVRRSVQVDGTALKAANQVQLTAGDTYTFTPAAEAGTTGDVITQANKRPNFQAIAEVGQDITIGSTIETATTTAPSTVTVNSGMNQYTDDGGAGVLFALVTPGMVLTWAGFVDGANNGAHTVVSKDSANTITVSGPTSSEVAAGVSFTRPIEWAGTRTIAAVGDGFIELADAQFVNEFESASDITVDNGLSVWTAWVVLPAVDRTEVWVNNLALQGMFKDNGGRSVATVGFEIEIEQLDEDLEPAATVEVVTGSLSGSTSDERAETVEHATAWTGPCRVRQRRTTPFDYDFNGTVIDEIKWTDLYAVSPVDVTHFGNKTTIHTVTLATPRATAARQRQLNCLVTRRLPTWSGSAWSGVLAADGSIARGTIHATTRMIDILAAVTVDPYIGNRSIAELDVAQVWGVQQELDALHATAGQFSYTFDNDNFSFEETAQAIANACFCIAYSQAGKIRLALDKPQSSSGQLFTHRNKRPQAIEPERISRSFANDSEFDGIEFVYVDPDTERHETIRLPLDDSAVKPRKMELPGIRHFAQAWLRANREYRKLIGQRMSIETAGLSDARLLLPNSRNDIVDNTRFKAYDGEVVGQSGLTLTLSQRVEFTPNLPHSIVLMKRNGSLQSITCNAGADDHQVVLASPPAEPIVTEYGSAGVRTIYSFAADSDRGKMAWLVQEVDPMRDGYVPFRAINYSDDYYLMDGEEIPAAAGVIN